MATLAFNGVSYTVDHAVKGADFIHGYDAASVMVVAFNGITDFSGFTYSGVYMEPKHCLVEECNDVKFMDGVWQTREGKPIMRVAHVTLASSQWGGSDPSTQVINIDGVTARSKVDLQPDATILQAMADNGVSALCVENDGGVLTVYAIGGTLTTNVTVQATITEVTA